MYAVTADESARAEQGGALTSLVARRAAVARFDSTPRRAGGTLGRGWTAVVVERRTGATSGICLSSTSASQRSSPLLVDEGSLAGVERAGGFVRARQGGRWAWRRRFSVPWGPGSTTRRAVVRPSSTGPEGRSRSRCALDSVGPSARCRSPWDRRGGGGSACDPAGRPRSRRWRSLAAARVQRPGALCPPSTSRSTSDAGPPRRDWFLVRFRTRSSIEGFLERTARSGAGQGQLGSSPSSPSSSAPGLRGQSPSTAPMACRMTAASTITTMMTL